MSHVRNLTLLVIVALGGILLSLNSTAVSSANPALDTQATFTVTNANDGGAGSLRIALGSANLSGGADTIVFDPTFFSTPRTINLTGELPPILESLTITGPGAHLLNIRRDTGGNYRIFTVNSGQTAVLTGLTISNGNPASGNGGGILNNGTQLIVTGCHITGNTAVSGGGISNAQSSTLILTQSTVSNNTAIGVVDGGGVGGGIASSGPTTINASTISGNSVTNSSGFDGGGIRLSGSTSTIANSTITNNRAAGTQSAGGLRDNLAPVTLLNNIIAGNVNNATVPDVSFASNNAINTTAYNLIGNRGTLTFSGTNDQSGTAAAVLNPQLAPLGNFGGTTPVHALLLNSPAFDKGAVDSPIATDQRGFNRRADIASIPNSQFGDGSDIGAVEMQAVFVTNTNDSGTGSLRQLILGAPAGSDIMFDPTVFNVSRTITLTSGEIAFSKNLTVSGPGANLLTISGNNTNRIFNIAGSGLNVAISGLTISNGKVGGPGGGVVINNSAGTFTDCAFIGNTASGDGGAVYLGDASGTFTGSTFSGNTAGGNRGGAVSVTNSSGSFTNCTVSGNKATFGAGIAMFNISGDQRLAVTNCTITNNTSLGNNASGLLVEVAAGLTTTATVRNSIIANNSGTDNVRGLLGGAFSPTTLISQGFNLTSDNSTTFLNQATDITNSNPQLGPLQNNGGATPTHALLPNSPAIDKGSAVAGLTTDQRGRARPFDVAGVSAANGGDSSDIGAVEMQASIVRNDEIVAVAGSLRQVIADAPAGAEILFDPAFFNVPRSIFVAGGEILINKSLTINGPGANLLTLSGANLNRVFRIAGGGLNVSISGVTISGGKAGDVGGGIVSDSNLTLTACAITNNEAGSGGGGVYVAGAVGTFTDCTFTGNRAAGYFSAVSLSSSSGAFTNCTISGNTTTGTGFGSIGLFATSGVRTLAVTSCTIANNTSTSNGGIYIESSGAGTNAAATIRNTIIANNTNNNISGTAAPGSFATVTSQGFNLTNDLTNGSLNQATDIVNANPSLGQLQNNGGLTQTRALLFGSPAIDKGSSLGTATDQRGVRRPVNDPLLPNATGGDGADIGAFERTAPAVVSAASFKGNPFAQESIVALFGENLTGGIAVASTVPLPVTLDNTSVMVSDSANTGRTAGLFFVSPGQLNFQIPPGTAVGAATISILRNGSVVASTIVNIVAVEPSLFTANASGTGLPAAILYRVRNGNLTTESVAPQIDLGPDGDVTVLVLYGGGIRKRSSLSAVTMKIGGITVGADFADAAPGFIGLDQINTAALPRSLAGKGLVNLELTVDGKPANIVQLNFK